MRGEKPAREREGFGLGAGLLLGRALATLLILSLCTPALAGDEDPPTDETPRAWELAVNLGEFGVFDRLELFEGGVELRLPTWRFGIRPTAGATFLENGGFYGYAGLRAEIELGQRFYVAPSMAIGLYKEGDFDLGGPLEFRNAVELGWRPSARTTLGVGLSHLSNGGIYDRNVGLETLYVSFGLSL